MPMWVFRIPSWPSSRADLRALMGTGVVWILLALIIDPRGEFPLVHGRDVRPPREDRAWFPTFHRLDAP